MSSVACSTSGGRLTLSDAGRRARVIGCLQNLRIEEVGKFPRAGLRKVDSVRAAKFDVLALCVRTIGVELSRLVRERVPNIDIDGAGMFCMLFEKLIKRRGLRIKVF